MHVKAETARGGLVHFLDLHDGCRALRVGPADHHPAFDALHLLSKRFRQSFTSGQSRWVSAGTARPGNSSTERHRLWSWPRGKLQTLERRGKAVARRGR